ncbi:hypothetical protein GON26_17305 [Flavobacterium sp. GA093]|uniref:Uncharacterized protein n=1 Tax=Flavobacterium hydrocarbonoxydans TaxID=2683249 RepID=A0A6I4NSV0_9FLAO|nr:hypothetical protein [Flavobacterium hydrocarbonoxydans]MWB96122.1 hypothetical protein [Flavobacterium hydrocarbonoxydans]
MEHIKTTIIGGIIIKEERADIFNFRNSKNDAYFGVYGKGMRFDDEYGNVILNDPGCFVIDD